VTVWQRGCSVDMAQESKRPINDSGVVFVIVNVIWVGVGPLPWL